MIDPISNFFQQQLTANNQDLLNFPANYLTAKKSLRDLVVEFFRQEDWEFTPTQNTSILRMACQGDNGQWRCLAKVQENEQQFAFYSVCSLKTPVAKRSAIAEFIARANYGMILGNFELDFDDGEIRYKTSIDGKENVLSIQSIEQLVYVNALMMDRYLPGISAIINHNLEPKQAIELIESQ